MRAENESWRIGILEQQARDVFANNNANLD